MNYISTDARNEYRFMYIFFEYMHTHIYIVSDGFDITALTATSRWIVIKITCFNACAFFPQYLQYWHGNLRLDVLAFVYKCVAERNEYRQKRFRVQLTRYTSIHTKHTSLFKTYIWWLLCRLVLPDIRPIQSIPKLRILFIIKRCAVAHRPMIKKNCGWLTTCRRPPHNMHHWIRIPTCATCGKCLSSASYRVKSTPLHWKGETVA